MEIALFCTFSRISLSLIYKTSKGSYLELQNSAELNVQSLLKLISYICKEKGMTI